MSVVLSWLWVLGMPPPALMLLRGDDAVPAVLSAVGGVAAAIIGIASARKKILLAKQQAREKKTRAPERRGASRLGKEKEMVYIPVSAGKTISAGSTDQPHIHPLAVFWFIALMVLAIISIVFGAVNADAGRGMLAAMGFGGFVVFLLLALVFMFCLKVVDQWDRVIVLRFGKFHAVRQPGIFWLTPFVDTVAKWIDTRVQTDDLLAEETLTKDTVPVDVDAVMFWLVYDPKKAALEVEHFESAVTWAAQTALRDLIGKTELAELLVGRDVLDRQLQEIIDQRTEPWGVTVQSVEIREIRIPSALQDAMSRQAQAERERQARVILGESEKQIAQSFADAAAQYKDNPTALHLRAMNMLFEGLKEKGSLMIIPSSAIDSMNLGAMGGLASIGLNPEVTGQPAGELSKATTK